MSIEILVHVTNGSIGEVRDKRVVWAKQQYKGMETTTDKGHVFADKEEEIKEGPKIGSIVLYHYVEE